MTRCTNFGGLHSDALIPRMSMMVAGPMLGGSGALWWWAWSEAEGRAEEGGGGMWSWLGYRGTSPSLRETQIVLELQNKGHIRIVPCREVVLISEVHCSCPLYRGCRRVLCQRF